MCPWLPFRNAFALMLARFLQSPQRFSTGFLCPSYVSTGYISIGGAVIYFLESVSAAGTSPLVRGHIFSLVCLRWSVSFSHVPLCILFVWAMLTRLPFARDMFPSVHLHWCAVIYFLESVSAGQSPSRTLHCASFSCVPSWIMLIGKQRLHVIASVA
ncbi:hypothetical protein M513_10280, partial [Trichuris suis]